MQMSMDFLEGRQETKEGVSMALYTPKARLSQSLDQVSEAMILQHEQSNR